MTFTAEEYSMYEGVKHGRLGTQDKLDKIMETYPIFNTPRCLELFNWYAFGYIMSMGLKGEFYE